MGSKGYQTNTKLGRISKQDAMGIEKTSRKRGKNTFTEEGGGYRFRTKIFIDFSINATSMYSLINTCESKSWVH